MYTVSFNLDFCNGKVVLGYPTLFLILVIKYLFLYFLSCNCFKYYPLHEYLSNIDTRCTKGSLSNFTISETKLNLPNAI